MDHCSHCVLTRGRTTYTKTCTNTAGGLHWLVRTHTVTSCRNAARLTLKPTRRSASSETAEIQTMAGNRGLHFAVGKVWQSSNFAWFSSCSTGSEHSAGGHHPLISAKSHRPVLTKFVSKSKYKLNPENRVLQRWATPLSGGVGTRRFADCRERRETQRGGRE